MGSLLLGVVFPGFITEADPGRPYRWLNSLGFKKATDLFECYLGIELRFGRWIRIRAMVEN